jgi:hypothetical protein
MIFQKPKTALAIAALLALGGAGQAHAGAYAASALLIENFTIAFQPLGSPPGSTINIDSFSFTTTNSATLNGNSVVSSANCNGTFVGPNPGTNCGLPPALALNALPANAPGGAVTRLDNNFALFGTGNGPFSNSDSVIRTAELTGSVAANTQQVAESEVLTTGTASANAEIQSTTGFTFKFTTADPGSLLLDFNATPFLQAALSAIGFISGNAQANVSASFTLENDTTSDRFSWSPQGTAGNDCTVTQTAMGLALGTLSCTERADTLDLNDNRGRSSPGNSGGTIFSPGTFGLTAAGLYAGPWTLSLNTVTSTQLRLETVPEPGTLALVGLALAAMGLRARRKSV